LLIALLLESMPSGSLDNVIEPLARARGRGLLSTDVQLVLTQQKRDAVARFFRVSHNRTATFEPVSAIFPRHVAPVVRQTSDGEREIVTMSWGFMLLQNGRAPRPVTNVRDDTILKSSFWKASFALSSGDVFVPFLLEDDDGIARANDWAEGFARGMKLRTEGWTELFDNEKHAGLLVPILALAHERDPDPAMRPYKEPIDAARREHLIIGAAAGVTGIYRFFAARRRTSVSGSERFRHRSARKGKSDAMNPVPAGQGKSSRSVVEL
jgi:Uncharacterised protein family (UPF0149)/SOS response associated peptidase (SRAP)